MARRHSDKEFDQLQRLKHENQKLKRENAKLRKHLQRMDVDRYNQLQEYAQAEQSEENQKRLEKEIEKSWGCYQCGNGVLILKIINRRDGTFYYRSCNSCANRTKLQKYTDKVTGVKNEESD